MIKRYRVVYDFADHKRGDTLDEGQVTEDDLQFNRVVPYYEDAPPPQKKEATPQPVSVDNSKTSQTTQSKDQEKNK